jgi:hypothetical protein
MDASASRDLLNHKRHFDTWSELFSVGSSKGSLASQQGTYW